METTNSNSNQKTSTSKKLSSQKLSYTKTSAIEKDKSKRKELVDALVQAEHTDSIKYKAIATSPESKEVFEVPLRATTTNKDKDLDVTKTSVWILMTLSQCTMKEVEDFEKKYKDNLTYNEKLSIKLLKDALRGNKQAQTIFWGLQEKVANRPKVLNQLNVTNLRFGDESTSVMSQMLDQITAKMMPEKSEKNDEITPQNDPVAQEGEIVA